MKRISYGLIMLAAILWGCIGIFTKTMNQVGFTPFELCFIRALVTVIVIGVIYGIYNPRIFRLDKITDLKYFIGSGILSFSLFNLCYITAIEEISLGVAAILLYTAPAIIMILSAILFGEKITMRKAVALLITFLGCILVTGIYGGFQEISIGGLFLGLGAGFGYALYSIFGKYALRKYSAMTLVFYTFLMSTLFFLCFVNPMELAVKITEEGMWGYGLLFALCSAAIPYVAYTKGLCYMEASKASIIATLEPIVAAMSGVVLFQEEMGLFKMLGIICIVVAIAIIK